MRRTKRRVIRNNIDLTDAIQVRAWTRRLGIKSEDLHRLIGRVGNSVSAVSRELKLAMPDPPTPVGPVTPVIAATDAVEAKLSAN